MDIEHSVYVLRRWGGLNVPPPPRLYASENVNRRKNRVTRTIHQLRAVLPATNKTFFFSFVNTRKESNEPKSFEIKEKRKHWRTEILVAFIFTNVALGAIVRLALFDIYSLIMIDFSLNCISVNWNYDFFTNSLCRDEFHVSFCTVVSNLHAESPIPQTLSTVKCQVDSTWEKKFHDYFFSLIFTEEFNISRWQVQ